MASNSKDVSGRSAAPTSSATSQAQRVRQALMEESEEWSDRERFQNRGAWYTQRPPPQFLGPPVVPPVVNCGTQTDNSITRWCPAIPDRPAETLADRLRAMLAPDVLDRVGRSDEDLHRMAAAYELASGIRMT